MKKYKARLNGEPRWKIDMVRNAVELEYDEVYINMIIDTDDENKALMYMGFARHKKWD